MDDPDIVKGETVRPKRRRRWLQFSLRSLLIFVLLCALANAWLSRKLRRNTPSEKPPKPSPSSATT